MKSRIVFIVAAMVQAASFGAMAQESALPPPHNMPGTTATPTTDRADADIATQRKAKASDVTTQEFVRKATLDGMTEVQVAQLALQKSKDPNVRAFAQLMVKDHTAAGEKLKVLATKEGVPVPASLDAEHQRMVKQMQSLNGATFDADYAKHMHSAHGEAVALFESASAGSAVSQPLREFAADTLPTLREHEDLAAKLDVSQTASDR